MSEAKGFRGALDALTQQPGETGSAYVVLSGTSESKPVQNFFRTDGLTALPLFMGTPYAGWHDVMPFLAQINTTSAFIDWIEESHSEDWGWGLVSRAPFDEVFGHIRSLTKITLADGHEVFFRYWAARFFGQILHSLDEAGRANLMGPIEAIVLPSGETIHHPGVPEVASPVPSFPWFSLPSEVQKRVAALCWDQLVGNTMAVLAKTRPSPLSRYPEPIARRKVERHVRRLCQSNVPTELEPSQLQSIHQALTQEASMGSRR
ncbi:DUF4123 domain-containing protein [Marinobacter nauticus]|uniref:DUF4123 domain-containing protein n=1 Tax=Marinobacter nauticus TaxID=2743 RepID=UPI001C9A187B|nr:DUF4123 domain-containing protein [Marinobacter nauticus]MBY5937595.1 DUF4123 domain-containing protein [Marinobacter nauticus]MBY5954823.1 DUF4123 domain-containing protein [Marinobacter nauticus]MBY6008616.1 DUF4123 domain-containing protein [Marinobacter nauticus]